MMRMQPLKSPAGARALRSLMQRRPLLGFDFDGTLAPIVAHPPDARVAHPLSRRLSRLSARLPVAVVSGRAVNNLEQHLSFRPRWIVGNHGAEHPLMTPDPRHARALDPVRERLRLHAADIEHAGVVVEDKGLSIALHYRCAPVLDLALATMEPLLRLPRETTRIVGGKRVINITAAGAPDKADAMSALVRACGAPCAFYIGDDANDECVFRRAPAHWMTVRVGNDDPHSAAAWFIESEADVANVLDSMLTALESTDE
jgi:trehalose 6-phosphate phosphatase